MEGGPNRLKNDIGRLEDIMIPKAHDPDALATEKGRSNRIIMLLFRKSVTAPINLHRELHLRAIEVENVVTDGLLSSEFEAAELLPPKQTPKAGLRVRGCVAHLASALD